jgi:hypothetical protein
MTGAMPGNVRPGWRHLTARQCVLATGPPVKPAGWPVIASQQYRSRRGTACRGAGLRSVSQAASERTGELRRLPGADARAGSSFRDRGQGLAGAGEGVIGGMWAGFGVVAAVPRPTSATTNPRASAVPVPAPWSPVRARCPMAGPAGPPPRCAAGNPSGRSPATARRPGNPTSGQPGMMTPRRAPSEHTPGRLLNPLCGPAKDSGTNGEHKLRHRPAGRAVPHHAPLVMAGVLVQVAVKPVRVIGSEPARTQVNDHRPCPP